jgi:hypothetical protein
MMTCFRVGVLGLQSTSGVDLGYKQTMELYADQAVVIQQDSIICSV